MERQAKLDIVIRAIEEAKNITPRGQDVKVYLSNILKHKTFRLQELYDILHILNNDEKILTLMIFPRYLLKLDLESYYYKDMLTGEKVDPTKEFFTVKVRRSFDKWCTDYWKLTSEGRIDWTSEDKQHKEDATKLLVQLFDAMQFHPKVIEASRTCFFTGNYRGATIDTFISLVDYVKEKTRLDLDGDNLMNQVFSFDYDKKERRITRYPMIRINELKNQSNRDEQLGFMYLCKGAAVGIRNPKVHKLIPQSNPFHTLEYLALASLLFRRVEEGKLEESEQTS